MTGTLLYPTRSALGVATTVCLVLASLFLGPPAHAAVTCSYSSGSQTVDVELSADLDWVFIRVEPGGTAIQTAAAETSGFPGTFSNCGSATVGNTTLIDVDDTSSAGRVTVEIWDGADFGSVDFDINFGDGDFDILNLEGSSEPDEYRLGGAGVANFNASDGDADITGLTGVEFIQVFGNEGADTLKGSGGGGTGGSATVGLFLVGGSGSDNLTGGLADDHLSGEFSDDPSPGNDTLKGAAGNDDLFGGPQDDIFVPGPGDDRLIGGAGTGDLVDYSDAPGAMFVRLFPGHATGEGSDDLIGIDSVTGSAFDDFITGHEGPNGLSGGGGGDRLMGRAGDDVLNGGDGTDLLNGSSGTDTCLEGERVVACE